MDTILEILAVIFGLLYLYFLIKEKIICWFFGILGSAISIWLFIRINLYSESILYVYYVLIGFYGYYSWSKKHKNETSIYITKWKYSSHILSLIIGLILGFGLAYYFNTYTDAKNAYLDAYTTIFSFIASYMEAKKILSSWIFWIFINGATIFLYYNRGLDIYSLLTVVYFISSFIGYAKWKKKFELINNLA